MRKFDFTPLHVAFVMAVLLAGIVLFSAILFLIGISISWMNLIGAACAVSLFLFFNNKLCIDRKGIVKLLALCAVLFSLFIVLSSSTFDSTWDGSAYHKQAIGQLREGWNPVYQSAETYNITSESTPYTVSNILFWGEVYPKATWYFAAAVYAITGNIESGKAYHFVMALILFCVFYDYLRTKISAKWKALLIALIAVANPIAISQFQSYYLDGFACNIVMCLIFIFSAMFDEEYVSNRLLLRIIAFCLILLGCNTKFSIAFLFSACVLCLCCFILYFKRNSLSLKLQR